MDFTKCLIYRRLLLLILVSPAILVQLPRTALAESKNELGQEVNSALGNMIQSPRAKLYTGTNFTGNHEQFKIDGKKKGCRKLSVNYSGQIKSVDTEGTCVRLFSNCNCESWSKAFYPGMDGNSIDSTLQGVKCIGPCSSNELDGAEIRGSASQLTVIKPKRSVPDLVGDWWTMVGVTAVNVSSLEHFQYILGAGNHRLEGVHGYIYLGSLRNRTGLDRVQIDGQNYTDERFSLDENKEEVGYGIPLELGGPPDKAYNVFPQDKAEADKYRQAFVPVITKYLRENRGGFVLLAVRFLYDDSTAVKPTGMWYRMDFIENKVTYGYLFNSAVETNKNVHHPEKILRGSANAIVPHTFWTFFIFISSYFSHAFL